MGYTVSTLKVKLKDARDEVCCKCGKRADAPTSCNLGSKEGRKGSGSPCHLMPNEYSALIGRKNSTVVWEGVDGRFLLGNQFNSIGLTDDKVDAT